MDFSSDISVIGVVVGGEAVEKDEQYSNFIVRESIAIGDNI